MEKPIETKNRESMWHLAKLSKRECGSKGQPKIWIMFLGKIWVLKKVNFWGKSTVTVWGKSATPVSAIILQSEAAENLKLLLNSQWEFKQKGA